MTLPIGLEDWLTDIGDQIVRKVAAGEYHAISSHEQLMYEIWLFDTETRNGGVSQYFCNHGVERWNVLLGLVHEAALPRLREFVEIVNKIVAGVVDLYRTVLDADVNLDTVYEQGQAEIVAELQAWCRQGG